MNSRHNLRSQLLGKSSKKIVPRSLTKKGWCSAASMLISHINRNWPHRPHKCQKHIHAGNAEDLYRTCYCRYHVTRSVRTAGFSCTYAGCASISMLLHRSSVGSRLPTLYLTRRAPISVAISRSTRMPLQRLRTRLMRLTGSWKDCSGMPLPGLRLRRMLTKMQCRTSWSSCSGNEWIQTGSNESDTIDLLIAWHNQDLTPVFRKSGGWVYLIPSPQPSPGGRGSKWGSIGSEPCFTPVQPVPARAARLPVRGRRQSPAWRLPHRHPPCCAQTAR